ncbi:TPA: hypothetical protein ACH3X2_004629 [Trebouxia sp. C0005]
MFSEMVLQGGCACRKVRYTVDGERPPSHFCHCRMCQLATGSPVAAFFTVPQTQVRFEGKLGVYQSSEKAMRKFCTECGTPLVYELQADYDGKRMLTQEVTCLLACSSSRGGMPTMVLV